MDTVNVGDKVHPIGHPADVGKIVGTSKDARDVPMFVVEWDDGSFTKEYPYDLKNVEAPPSQMDKDFEEAREKLGRAANLVSEAKVLADKYYTSLHSIYPDIYSMVDNLGWSAEWDSSDNCY